MRLPSPLPASLPRRPHTHTHTHTHIHTWTHTSRVNKTKLFNYEHVVKNEKSEPANEDEGGEGGGRGKGEGLLTSDCNGCDVDVKN